MAESAQEEMHGRPWAFEVWVEDACLYEGVMWGRDARVELFDVRESSHRGYLSYAIMTGALQQLCPGYRIVYTGAPAHWGLDVASSRIGSPGYVHSVVKGNESGMLRAQQQRIEADGRERARILQELVSSRDQVTKLADDLGLAKALIAGQAWLVSKVQEPEPLKAAGEEVARLKAEIEALKKEAAEALGKADRVTDQYQRLKQAAHRVVMNLNAAWGDIQVLKAQVRADEQGNADAPRPAYRGDSACRDLQDQAARNLQAMVDQEKP